MSTKTVSYAVTASANVTFTASEFFPYDPGDDDGPIYDTATGQQLRAFP
jgi:hypothetical protein